MKIIQVLDIFLTITELFKGTIYFYNNFDIKISQNFPTKKKYIYNSFHFFFKWSYICHLISEKFSPFIETYPILKQPHLIKVRFIFLEKLEKFPINHCLPSIEINLNLQIIERNNFNIIKLLARLSWWEMKRKIIWKIHHQPISNKIESRGMRRKSPIKQ